MSRSVRASFLIGLFAFVSAVGLLPQEADALTLPKGGVVEVTGYKQICCDGQSDPVVVQITGQHAAEVRTALANLLPTTFQTLICMETVIPFRVAFRTHKGGAPTVSATATSCGGEFVTVRVGGSEVVLKDDCELEHAIVTVLPHGMGQGTRQAFEPTCPSNPAA